MWSKVSQDLLTLYQVLGDNIQKSESTTYCCYAVNIFTQLMPLNPSHPSIIFYYLLLLCRDMGETVQTRNGTPWTCRQYITHRQPFIHTCRDVSVCQVMGLWHSKVSPSTNWITTGIFLLWGNMRDSLSHPWRQTFHPSWPSDMEHHSFSKLRVRWVDGEWTSMTFFICDLDLSLIEYKKSQMKSQNTVNLCCFGTNYWKTHLELLSS